MAPEALTEKDLDLLIEEVEQDYKKMAVEAEANLKKSDKKAEKAEMCKDDEQKPEEAAPEAPAEEAAPEAAMQPAPAEEAAPEAPAEEMAPEAGLAEEAAQMQEPSWEELFSQLPEEELAEIHDALIAVSQKKWSAEGAAQEAPAEEAAPMEAAPEMGKAELRPDSEANGKIPGMKKEEPKAEAKKEEAMKSEKDENYAKLEKAVEELVKAVSAKVPARKDAIEVIAKGEVIGGEKLEKSDDEVYQEARKLVKSEKLSNSEREIIVGFFSDRSNSAPVRKILETKSKK